MLVDDATAVDSAPPRRPLALAHLAAGARVPNAMTSREAAGPLPPRLTQPWLVPFLVWRENYAYFVDRVCENIRVGLSGSRLSGSTFDWVGVRADLERYLYDTGHSRFRTFYLLSGPRPPSEAPPAHPSAHPLSSSAVPEASPEDEDVGAPDLAEHGGC